MPELRKDPVLGHWVAFAPDRAQRPLELGDSAPQRPNGYCPFCAGHEDATPHQIMMYRNPDRQLVQSDWRVRVVPNKFPALQVEGQLTKRGDGIYDMMTGIGAHEVIIECAHHETNIANLSVEHVQDVLWCYRDRLVDLKRDVRMMHGLVFKNKGLAAGASLEHSHSQLIATPIVPSEIHAELEGARQFHHYRGRCIYCDIITQELHDQSRVVLDTANFLVISPYAARFPFETWILPKHHSSHFENISRPNIEEMGLVLKTVLRKLEIALDDPAYNYVIHSAPFKQTELAEYHWHVEIIPRLTKIAGFEWGSGCHINIVMPEVAAAFLRDIDVDVHQPSTHSAPVRPGQ